MTNVKTNSSWEPTVGSSCTDCGQIYTWQDKNGLSVVDCANNCLTGGKSGSNEQNPHKEKPKTPELLLSLGGIPFT